MRSLAVAATVSLALCGLGSSCAADVAKPKSCEAGKDALTITFAVGADGQCAVEGDVPVACVDQDKKITWTLVNKDCDFDASKTAVEMSSPKLKTDKTKSFKWEGDFKQNGWAKGKDVKLTGKVPKDTEEGLYKYDITGQIKTLDPDIEVRRGN